MNKEHLKFNYKYPRIYNFLNTVIHPDVDGYNLLELLHRIMKNGKERDTKELVSEFFQLKDDFDFDGEYLENLFNYGVPKNYQIIKKENCRVILNTLSEYLTYLCDVEGVKGHRLKWI